MEEKASGIALDELSDYEKALEESIAKFVDIELYFAKEREINAKAIKKKERETATDMRQQCMETFSETNKRKDNAAAEQITTKRRKSGDDTIPYLREKMNMDKQLRERELNIAEQRENTMQQLLIQQQQQNQAMLALLSAQNNSNNQ